jgi:phosphotransferase system  glucose/maltose/N-acetylglucosamine-specific IIC component
MPKLIRMYIINVAIGFGIAAGFVAMLLYFNIANLWHLVIYSDKGWLAVLVLWLANGIVFAGVQFAIAVMKMKDDDDDGPGGGLRERVSPPVKEPVLVRVAAPKPRNS